MFGYNIVGLSITILSVLTPSVLLVLSVIGTATAAPAPGKVDGYYELESNPADPAYNEYLEAIGVSEPFRQVMSKIKMHIQIQKNDNESYTYKVITPLLSHSTTFKFGEELEDQYVDKRKFKTTFTLEADDTVKQVLKFDDVTASSVYTFNPEGLVAVETAKDKTVVRKYKRT